MKLYAIEVANIDLSNHHDYVLANNFDEAYRKAIKLVDAYKSELDEAAELVAIQLENEITEVTDNGDS